MDSVQVYERKQRRKIIIATVAMGVILLGVLVWAIVAAVNSAAPATSSDDTQPIVATEDSVSTETPGVSNDNTAANSANATDGAATDGTVSSDTVAGDLPSTGPTDSLPAILLIGASVTLFLINRRLVAERVPQEVFLSK